MTTLKLRALLLATTAGAVLTMSADAGAPLFFGGPELVTNGGFETGPFGTFATVTGWSCTLPSASPKECTDAVGGGKAPTPAHAFLGFDDGATGTLAQTVHTATSGTIGGIYQVKFDYKTDSGTLSPTLAFKFGAAAPVSLGLTSSYQASTNIYATGTANTSLAFSFRTFGVDEIRLDNVSVIEIDDGAGNNLAAASQTIAAQASREFMEQLYDRFGHSGSPMQLASAGETVVASNGGMTYINGPGHYRAFLNVYGDDARWDSGDVRSHRLGFVLGAEWAPCNDFDLGLAIGRTTSHFNTNTLFTDNSGRADETLGALFANWSPNSGPFYVTGVAGYGRSTNDFMRVNGFGSVGADGVASEQWFGGVEAGFDWRGWSRMTLTPFARVDAARLRQDGYLERNESGVLIPALVDSKDQTAGRTLIGLRASTNFNLVGRYPWQLSGKAAWQHEFDRTRSVTFSETSGVTFFGTATGATPAANSALVGASLEAPLTDHASLYAGYTGDFGSGQRIHQGEVGFKVTW